MITILSAVICLHHFCTEVIIPTPATLTPAYCANTGHFMALQHAPKNWRVVGVFCIQGIDV